MAPCTMGPRQMTGLLSSRKKPIDTNLMPNRTMGSIAPLEIAQELLDGAVHHGAAPDDRLALVEEEANRHQFDAEPHDGFDRAIGDRARTAGWRRAPWGRAR